MPLITDDYQLVVAALKGCLVNVGLPKLTVSTGPHSVLRRSSTLSPLVFVRPLGAWKRLVISLIFPDVEAEV